MYIREPISLVYRHKSKYPRNFEKSEISQKIILGPIEKTLIIKFDAPEYSATKLYIRETLLHRSQTQIQTHKQQPEKAAKDMTHYIILGGLHSKAEK
jgi:hypothetical protein